MGKKILLAESDRGLLEVMRVYLENRGFSVVPAESGEEALRLARGAPPALVLADVKLTGLGGLELCKAVKAAPETAGTPVIMLSAEKTEDADLVAAYEQGADDYLPKPFSYSLLAAKINAVLRRCSSGRRPRSGKIRQQGLELDPAVRTVKFEGRTTALTRKEFDLLLILLEKKDRVLGVPYLLETVWGHDMATYDNPHTVETHISALRKKLGRKFAGRLVNVTGRGYKLIPRESRVRQHA